MSSEIGTVVLYGDVATGEQTCSDMTARIIVLYSAARSRISSLGDGDLSLVAEQSQPSK